MIADHLPALARGHFTSIAKALGVSRAQIQQVLDLIRRRLRPYPAFDGNAPAVSSYVVPDVVVQGARRDRRRLHASNWWSPP